MTKRNYKFEWTFLFVALFLAAISLIGDSFTDSYRWFSRSGAIIVLIGVIVEYRISDHIFDDIQRAQFQQSKIELSIPFKARPTKHRKRISIAAHTTIILGTLICGYGDLIWS